MVGETPLNQALALVGLTTTWWKDSLIKKLPALGSKIYTFRHFGAATVDLAYLAAGKADLVLFERLTWWDIAAGVILIQEAGGVVTTFEGETITPQYPSLCAGSPMLHQEFLPFFKT
jgi:myo-inositol-1(or 4)-monophosphatase